MCRFDSLCQYVNISRDLQTLDRGEFHMDEPMSRSTKDAGPLQNSQAEPASTGSDTAGMSRFDSRNLPELPPTLLEESHHMVDGNYWAMKAGLPASSGPQQHSRDVFSAVPAPHGFEDGKLAAAVAAAGRASHQQAGRTQPPSSCGNTARRPPRSCEAQVHGELSNIAGDDEADGHLSSHLQVTEEQGTGKAGSKVEAGKAGAACEKSSEPGQRPSVMMRKPSRPSVRLEIRGNQPESSPARATGAQARQVPAGKADRSRPSTADPARHVQVQQEQPPSMPMQEAADPSHGSLGAYISPMPGRGHAGASALGQARGSCGWTVETGRPEAPASPPRPPAPNTFAISDWNLGRGPPKLASQDPMPLQPLRDVSRGDQRANGPMQAGVTQGSAGLPEPIPHLPWLPDISQPAGSKPGLQPNSSHPSPILCVSRGWPNADLPVPLSPSCQATLAAASHASNPGGAPANSRSLSGADNHQGNLIIRPSLQVQRCPPGGPVPVPDFVQKGKLPDMDWAMPLGADGIMPLAQFKALRALQLQQGDDLPRPDDPEAAALLAGINSRLPSSGTAPHKCNLLPMIPCRLLGSRPIQ